MRLDNAALQALYDAYAHTLAARAYGRTGDHAHPVFGEGECGAYLMLIGEAPGGEEAASGRPFVGRAGKNLDAMLAKAGLSRREIFVTNAVKFRPTAEHTGRIANRTPTVEECREALSLLREEIALVQPVLIATLGNTPLRSILWLANGAVQTVGALHGTMQSVSIEGRNYGLFALYHPASAIYNRALGPVLEEDICRLGGICKEKGAELCGCV